MAATIPQASGSPFPSDYPERVYAGVLGKIIGVYLGRPVEGWSYERISRELGEVDYYVNDRLQRPLVVTDDDISGTFAFVRAFADYGYDADLTPGQIGQTWLNYLIEGKTVLWWGGMGNSTEHTAYLRLKHGIPAPQSGAIATNGKVVAEQIGAQIFVDGWAMLCPGDPEGAADYARRAASVSHDGEAIYGAQVIAALEAGAFVERNLDALLDQAVRLIPSDSLIARLIGDVRDWRQQDGDWRRTRERIAGRYGYDRYGGNCHIVPNHALIHLGLLYGDGDFDRSLMVTTTAGWDTDCNAGNVGCILGIRNGLAAFGGPRDWRGPVADRLYVSTADGGRTVTDAVTEARRLVSTAGALRGLPPEPPSDGLRFDFELPGSIQGWAADPPAPEGGIAALRLENVAGHSAAGRRSLALHVAELGPGKVARAGSPTFIPPDALALGGYGLMASPTLYGGQTTRARLAADHALTAPLTARLYVRSYGEGAVSAPQVRLAAGPAVTIQPGQATELEWTLPEGDGDPIWQVGLELASEVVQGGTLYLDWLGWTGSAAVSWRRPAAATPAAQRSWVTAVDLLQARADWLYTLVQNEGRGLALMGGRSWTNYTLQATVRPHMAQEAGIAARAQGLQRYYALLLRADGMLRLLKRAPGEGPDGRLGERTLAEQPQSVELDRPYRLELDVDGGHIVARLDGRQVFAVDDEAPLLDGAIGLVVSEGRVDVDEVAMNG